MGDKMRNELEKLPSLESKTRDKLDEYTMKILIVRGKIRILKKRKIFDDDDRILDRLIKTRKHYEKRILSLKADLSYYFSRKCFLQIQLTKLLNKEVVIIL